MKKDKITQTDKLTKNRKNRCQYSLIMEGNQYTFYNREIVIYFGHKKSSKKTSIKPCYPTFNKDNKYYTPAFYSPQHGEFDEGICYDNHHTKKAKALALVEEQSHQQIFVPKPSRRHDYCGVCRKSYQQYLEHICSDSHKSKLERSYWHHQLIKTSQKFLEMEPKKEDECNNELTQVNKIQQN